MDEHDLPAPAEEASFGADKRKAWLRATLAGMEDGVVLTDATGSITFLNPAAQAITGWTLQQVRGAALSVRLQFIDAARQPIEPGPADALASGVSIALAPSSLVVGKDARERPVEGSFIPVHDLQNRVTGLVVLLRDAAGGERGLAERKRAQAALERSEQRYRRLFEAAKDGILILDSASGRIVDANPYISELLGYTLDELHGKELWEIGFFKDKQANQDAYDELRQTGYIRYDHLPLKSKADAHVAVEFVSNSYLESGAEVVQCNIRDITERSRLEQQTRAQAQELSELNRRKDEFLAMLSHELRNPLAAIHNAVALLGMQDKDGALRPVRSIVERQVGQLTHLVDDLLEIARITSGRIRLRLEGLDVRGTVQRAVESMQSSIAQRRQSLSVSMPPQPLWLQVDPGRLEQVLVNLLSNASKYTDRGGNIALVVAPDEEHVVIRVSDNGIGIARGLLARIFDPFIQAERSLDRAEGGLGIGLTLAQRVIEMHGGTIEAHSEGPGRGSEFVIRLPSRSAPMEDESSPQAPVKEPREAWRILVVDDNVDAADSLAMLFQADGHDAKVAYSSEEALLLARDYRPDFVLLDIGLPGMDGYEVAKRLRAQPELQNLRLIALTGYGQDSDVARSREAGFDHHVVKPVQFDSLNSLLASLATRRQQ